MDKSTKNESINPINRIYFTQFYNVLLTDSK